MLHNSVRLFTIRGIEVGVHYSWLIIFALLTWSLAIFGFRQFGVELSEIEYWVLAAIASLLLFVSVLIHELAHSFMALARGLAAKSITLFIFGGVSNLGGEAKKPSTEFLVAIVGPLTSFALAVPAALLWAATWESEPRIGLVAGYLAIINVILGLFNLIPGFPLDGGRVLRAILWTATGSVRRATEGAATVGKVIAWGLFGFGLFQILALGNLFGGIWMAAIAWFLHNAASASVQQVVFETRLRRVRARDITRRDDTAVPPGLSVAELIEDYLLPRNRRAMAVSDNGRLVGMVTVSDLQRVPSAQRSRVSVAEVMGGREGLVTIDADARVQQAVELLAEHEFEQLPVLEDGRLVGMLTRADVMRQLQLREALDV
ncbi:MAG TPA: site-2 protease family protein [Candidatus Limnocylindrales bacterium]|jgi:Zn-dependent protease/CBS domain-containing protein|nr:site-2 protease family protein [Candidatus Limnocylindrales bacterium]